MPKVGGFPKTDLPGRARYPLAGAAPRYLQYLADPVGTLLAARPLGDVVGVAAGDPSFVFVFGEPNVRQVLSDHLTFRHDEDLVKAKPGTPIARLESNLVSVNGDVHKRLRRLEMAPLRGPALPAFAAQISELSAQAIDRWPTGGTVDIDQLTSELALRVAMRCFFGLDVSGDIPFLGGIAARWMVAFSAPLAILAPFDLPGTPYRRSMRLTGEVIAQLEELIARTRSEPVRLDALSQLVHDTSDDALVGDELLTAASAYFVAGHETTAKTLMWTLFLLDQHPDVLAAVRNELADVLGDRPPEPDDLMRLVVLDRVVRESMRVLTSVPQLFFRVADHEVTIDGRRLPPRANIVVSPLLEHRDAELYPSPLRFEPDRWDGLRPPPYTYLPFGAGPRICIGAAFATQAIRIMLAMILQRRRLHGRPGTRINRLVRTNILMPRGGLTMEISPAHDRRLTPPPVRGDIHQLVELGPTV